MKYLTALLFAISMPTMAANTTVQNPFNSKNTKRTPASTSCDNLPRTCKQMTSCEQAKRAYRCGNTRLDRDKDGVPCENLCK